MTSTIRSRGSCPSTAALGGSHPRSEETARAIDEEVLRIVETRRGT